MRCVVELGVNVVPGTAGTSALWAAALDHEPADNAMKRQAAVVSDSGQPDYVATMSGSHIRKQIQQNSSVGCVKFDLVFVGVEVDILDRFKNFRLAVCSHDFGLAERIGTVIV